LGGDGFIGRPGNQQKNGSRRASVGDNLKRKGGAYPWHRKPQNRTGGGGGGHPAREKKGKKMQQSKCEGTLTEEKNVEIEENIEEAR